MHTVCVFLMNFLTLQDFTVLLTEQFHRYVIRSSSVIFYRRYHWRITSVGFPLVGDSPFRRFIGRKKNHLPMVLQTEFKKKDSRLKYTDRVNMLVSVWNTDRIYPSIYSSVRVAATAKCRRINSVGNSVGECLKYWPNISVCIFVSTCGSYC
jgi:hypothetical protein